MFGTWGSNNANNPANNPAQGTSAGFGTTNAFGQPAQNTGGFGAFGQPQANQTQPATGFGAAPTTNAFGAFGGGSTAFGAKPATGFGTTGAFGAATQPAAGTTGFGGGGFGTNTASTGIFGQPAGSTTAGTSTFGGTGFGSTTATNSTWGKPAIGGFGAAAYINYSPEELRVQDYAVGRKNAASNVPAAPQAGGFGASTTGTTGFGAAPATNAFGQPAQPTGGFGGFGTTNTNTGGGLFGNTATTGFGTTPTTTNAFGQPATGAANPFAPAAPTTGGFGTGFGSTTTNTGFGANTAAKPFGFGTSPATNTTGAFGAFGQPAANTNPTTNAFGQPATNSAFGGFGTGAFGQANTGTSAFGQPTATTNAFGQPTQPATSAFGQPATNTGTGGGFGAFGQQNQAQTTTNPFGQPAQPAQNTNPFGSGFGQPAAQQATGTTTGFGGLFNKPATPTLTTGGFGGFGQPAANQQQPNQFGSALGGGLLGQGASNTATNNTGMGLFGQGGGIFGQPKPGGLLGNGTGTNMFGQTTVAGLGGAINANPAAASTNTNPFSAFSGFGQPAANTNNASTSTNLFTQSSLQLQQQQQPSLTASVDQPFDSGVPVFELLPGASSSGFSSSAFGKKKQSNFFMKRKPLPSTKSITSLTASTTGVNPLRGFASSSSTSLGSSITSTRPGPSGISLMLKGGTTPTTSNPMSFASSFMGGSLSEKKSLNSEVFSNSPGRQSVKKLVLDKDPSIEDLSNALSRNTAKKHTSNALELTRASPAGAQNPASRALVHKPTDFTKSTVETDKLEKGDYWISPAEEVLVSTAFKDLEAVLGFKCGRVGYGQVEFLEPVNLTMVGAVKEIAGKFIIFDQKECTVYPDESDKPPVGQGLNVRAKITLEGCWATDRATREPIKTEDHPKHAAHLKKLKNMNNTTFESFDIEKGAWTFIVEHFSRYGLGAEDDEEEDQMVAEAEMAAAAAAAPVVPPVMDRSMEKPSSDDDDESMADDTPRMSSLRPRDVSMRRSKEPTPGHRRRSSSNRRREEMAVDENDADNDDEDDEIGEDVPERVPPSWPAQLGMDPQRVGQMQQSLFSAQNATASRQRSVGVGKAVIKPPARSGTPSALGKHPRELGLMEEDIVENGALGMAASVEDRK